MNPAFTKVSELGEKLLKQKMKFQGIRIFQLNIGNFKKGAAMTIPGIGIFVGKGMQHDTELLRHEFGHVLQCRKWGFWFFWRSIASDSLKSALNQKRKYAPHMHTWTEWSANWLAYQYFDKPGDWNFSRFPITPAGESRVSKPKFAWRRRIHIRFNVS
ncbi:MAG: hypothetical protein H6Q19_1704 [Bacteroidetes bacterium]|nr:hypothetical protein [Bacteroidota bacterium]